jgi:hypothetical protein
VNVEVVMTIDPVDPEATWHAQVVVDGEPKGSVVDTDRFDYIDASRIIAVLARRIYMLDEDPAIRIETT